MTDMVCPHRVDSINVAIECHRLIYDELKEIMWCGFSCEELELLIYGTAPCYDDPGRDLV